MHFYLQPYVVTFSPPHRISVHRSDCPSSWASHRSSPRGSGSWEASTPRWWSWWLRRSSPRCSNTRHVTWGEESWLDRFINVNYALKRKYSKKKTNNQRIWTSFLGFIHTCSLAHSGKPGGVNMLVMSSCVIGLIDIIGTLMINTCVTVL